MKKALSLFLSIVMLISVIASVDLSAYADTYSDICGNNVKWELDTDTGVLTISGNGNMADYAHYDVASWSDLLPYIKTVDIKYGVTSIGDYAFYNCTSLTSIAIPNSVTSIGNGAFYQCESLTDITIPDSVTSIGDYAFYGCIGLTSITIPDSVTSIGNNAFWACASLTSITLPNCVTSIGENTFGDCTSLTSITIPNGVTSIDEYAFSNCKSLTNVTIPNGVTSIDGNAFRNCESLTSITIPDSVTSIGYYAFTYCESLTSITIPSSVTSIGNSAFDYCSSLTSIDVDSNNKSYSSEDGILFNKSKTELLKYPEGKSGSSYTIPDGVTSIDGNAFRNCTSLASITIPNGVTSIGDYAFYNCESLTSIVIPYGVTSIGGSAFGLCESLASITMPNSVTSIGGSAFWACASLTSITIPNGVTSIGENTFENCTNLTSITIPNGVTSIGNNAFWNCISLASITIPKGVTSIDDNVFFYCESLASITIPNSVTSIGVNAFYNCKSLKDVYYSGTIEQWNKIVIGSSNEDLTNAMLHCTDGTTDEEEHTHSYSQNVTAPTCTEQGYTIYTCSCGDGYVEDFVPATGHTPVTDEAAAPTCTETGLTEGSHCSVCGYVITAQKVVNATGHNYKNTVAKATLTANGSIADKCTLCGDVKSSTTIYYPKSISLSNTSFTYNGNVQQPNVTVKDSNGTVLKNNGDYKVTYQESIDLGIYNVNIEFIGNYEGTKDLTYTIKPRATEITSVTATAYGFKLNWNKVDETTGYQLQYSTNSNFSGAATVYGGATDTTSKTITGRAAGTKYYVRVRTYKTFADESRVWGNWSSAEAVTTPAKPKNTSISSVASVVNGFKVNWTKVSDTTGYQIQYSTRSDFKGAATVYGGATNTISKTITGRAAGTKYYVRVRTYRTLADGSRVWGNWTSAKAVTTKVQKATLKSLSPVSRGFKATWNKIGGVTGYQIQYATRSDFKGAATVYAGNSSAVSKTITGRARNTKYYVRVRGYKNNNGSYVYGAWSSAKSVKTK